MLALKIIVPAISLSFLLFGYFIFVKGKYDLINGFAEDLKAGRKTEKYARRVGLTELVIGIVGLIGSALLIALI